MKKLFLILIGLSLFECSKYGSNFQVSSQRNFPIDSVIISNGFNSSAIYGLQKNKDYNTFLDFKTKRDTLISDGSYTIKVYQGNKLKEFLNFGYYSNGIPSSSSGFRIEIKNDTILIDEFWD